MDYVIEWVTVNKVFFYLPLGIAILIFVAYHLLRVKKERKQERTEGKGDRDRF